MLPNLLNFPHKTTSILPAPGSAVLKGSLALRKAFKGITIRKTTTSRHSIIIANRETNDAMPSCILLPFLVFAFAVVSIVCDPPET